MTKKELNSDLEIPEHNEYEFTNGNSELRSSGMAYTDNISFTEKSRTLEILEKMIDELNTNKDNSDDIEILTDQEDSYNRNGTLFEPCTIIHSGFHNSKLIDEAMLHLYLKNKFYAPNNKTQNNINNLHYNSSEQFRPAYENDDNLIKLWQENIASRKKIEQTSEILKI
ncbi:22147_t:CDS:2 [Gigaspora rosea]|nr:22147_t:CDS:2 [Gigaspora rosea]